MTKWDFEYRAFTEEDITYLIGRLNAIKELVGEDQTVTDKYFVGPSDISARVRGREIKIRGPEEVVDELVNKVRDDRYNFPLQPDVIEEAIGVDKQTNPLTLSSLDALESYFKQKIGVAVNDVFKESRKYDGPGFEVEVTGTNIGGKKLYTASVAANAVQTIHDVLKEYDIDKLPGSKTMDYSAAIKQIMGK